MAHPLVLALFDHADTAARAARALRDHGVPASRVSIVASSHDEEGVIATAADATPGSELEDSRPASRIGELSAHFLAAVALALPGLGPIVADGPLAAGLGEAAGHLAGGLARALGRAGLTEAVAAEWERLVGRGAVLIGAHAGAADVDTLQRMLQTAGASHVVVGSWPD